MDKARINIDQSRGISLIESMDNPLEYEYLVDQFDCRSIENKTWGYVRKNLVWYDRFFKDTSVVNMTVYCTPSLGTDHRSGGAMFYRNKDDYFGERAVLSVSLRVLARVHRCGQQSPDEFLKDMVRHELCHLKMFQNYGDHPEDHPTFQGYLQEVRAPTHFTWTTGTNKYP